MHTPIYPLFCTFDPAFGWGDFVKGRLTLKVVPGAHESILDEPYVREVARELRVCLGEIANTAQPSDQIQKPELNALTPAAIHSI
jgi:thioesterase domain-containing protein